VQHIGLTFAGLGGGKSEDLALPAPVMRQILGIETPPQIAECRKQWGPSMQMTKEEWAASCRSKLGLFRDAKGAEAAIVGINWKHKQLARDGHAYSLTWVLTMPGHSLRRASR
jgi:hypothetical protein